MINFKIFYEFFKIIQIKFNLERCVVDELCLLHHLEWNIVRIIIMIKIISQVDSVALHVNPNLNHTKTKTKSRSQNSIKPRDKSESCSRRPKFQVEEVFFSKWSWASLSVELMMLWKPDDSSNWNEDQSFLSSCQSPSAQITISTCMWKSTPSSLVLTMSPQ